MRLFPAFFALRQISISSQYMKYFSSKPFRSEYNLLLNARNEPAAQSTVVGSLNKLLSIIDVFFLRIKLEKSLLVMGNFLLNYQVLHNHYL